MKQRKKVTLCLTCSQLIYAIDDKGMQVDSRSFVLRTPLI